MYENGDQISDKSVLVVARPTFVVSFPRGGTVWWCGHLERDCSSVWPRTKCRYNKLPVMNISWGKLYYNNLSRDKYLRSDNLLDTISDMRGFSQSLCRLDCLEYICSLLKVCSWGLV